MSAQRARSVVAADHRSIHPSLPGLPWWAAVVVAVTATAIGFAFDAGSGNKELTNVFAALYVLGCVAAVLAVRQSGVFTAVIQPPLILFCAVPGAYWLFHGATFTGIKGILINCGYPLIERFPLMLFTSALVLLIGLARWYVGMAARPATPKPGDEAVAGPHRLALIAERVSAKLTALFNRDATHAARTARSRPRRTDGARPRRTAAQRRDPDTGRRSAPTRSRHVRPPMGEAPDPRAERSRRRTVPGGAEEPPRRRRPRPPQDSARRDQQASRTRRDPGVRTGRPTAHNHTRDRHRRVEPPEPSPRRRQPPGANGDSNGADTTHHPISRVRYRNMGPDETFGSPESHGRSPEPRRRSPESRGDTADSWQYDI